MQEKAEQEAKKNKKKALLGIPDDDADHAAPVAASGPDPRVTEMLMQIQKERKALQMEKEAMTREMQEMRSVMTSKMNQMQEELEQWKAEGLAAASSDKKGGKKGWFGRKGGDSNNDSFKETEDSAGASSDPKLKAEIDAMKEIDSLKDQIIESLNQSLANLQADNKRYKQQQQSQEAPASRAPASDDAVTTAALADLEERIDALERDSARIERQVNRNAEEYATQGSLAELLNRLKALENGAVRNRARDRSRSLGENQLRVDNNGVPRGGTRASVGATPASRAAAARMAATSPVSTDDSPTPQASPRASPRPAAKAPAAASPVARPPRRTTSDASSSSSSSSGSSSSSDSEAKKPKGPPVATATPAAMERFVRPHSIATMAKAQARDERLMKFLEKPGGAGAMYPKFCMSVKSAEGAKLIFFHKRCYIPEALRQKTLRYYYENHNDEGHWSQAMSRSAIWPTLDADVTTFKP